MPRIKIRPADMAKIHKTQPPGDYGRCQFRYCGCPEYRRTRLLKIYVATAFTTAVIM